jgi:hypothetical protein
MVRRGSTVRVRQRALQKPRNGRQTMAAEHPSVLAIMAADVGWFGTTLT